MNNLSKEHEADLFTSRWYATEFKKAKDLKRVSFLADEFHKELTEKLGKDEQGNPVQATEPERPNEPKRNYRYTVPKIVDVNVNYRNRGSYRTKTGNARGLVVHYTAGRMSPPEDSAVGMVRWLASKGLGCLVMDTNGVIYKAKNSDVMKSVNFHAGDSAWQGKTAVSWDCMGMEICGPGLVAESGRSWFKKVYDLATTRKFNKKTQNIYPGRYVKFTKAQEESLINFCLWQLDVNPEFSIGWIIGHDECATPAGRKTDPGGSLSMTMPGLRTKILGLSR